MTRTDVSHGANELLLIHLEGEKVEVVNDPESTNSWVKTSTIPELRDGDLQIWRLDLDGPDSRSLLTQAFEALTAEERQRAAKMRTGTAPEEFIAGRGFLRRLLSASLNCDPRGVGIVLGTHRKPALRPVRGVRMPHFNVSHSRGIVLIALSHSGSVGVDVEYMDSAVETIDVARAAFHADDLRRIESACTAQERLLAFYACWTRREAVAKADGRGLTLPASGFSTGMLSDVEQVVEIGGEGTVAGASRYSSRYFVRNLCVSPCHLGGVAVARSCPNPILLELSCLVSARVSQRSATLNLSSNAWNGSNEHAITFSSNKTHLSGD